ncbi:MAG TPA: hypothetical protein VE197_08405, partial [Mycobacterium sp.]|nr:hypothetical protein [Mycobacterium sp.]
DYGAFPPDRIDKDGSGAYYVTNIDIPNVPVGKSAQNWFARVWAACDSDDPGPAAAVESAACSVGPTGLPAANLVGNLVVSAGDGSDFPYNQTTPDGTQFFSIAQIACDTAAAATDPNTWVFVLTAQDFDAAGNPIGPEQLVTDVGCGDVVHVGPLMGAYGTQGGSYQRANPFPNGTPTNIAQVGLRVYICNNSDLTEAKFQNPACATLQTLVGTNGLLLVTVAANGQLPPGAIPADRLDPTKPIQASQIGTVNATSIQGSITANQIGTVNATSIQGSLTAAQIGTVNATSIQGTLTATQIGTVNATSIQGQLTADQIATVNASAVQGSLAANQIGTVNATSV